MSGLSQRFTKPSALNCAREFESHSLRFEAPRKRREAMYLSTLRVRFEQKGVGKTGFPVAESFKPRGLKAQ